MYKHLLKSVENIDWLGIIPLLIFFIFFVAVTISVFRKKRSFIEKMKNLPLEEE
jgi:cytochrome c oxidase cbb3-type subunit IV